MNIGVIIVASGSGERMKAAVPKQFMMLKKKKILDRSIDLFADIRAVREIVVVVPPAYVGTYIPHVSAKQTMRVVGGGSRRIDSVRAGIACVSKTADAVVIHDGARPLTRRRDILRCINAAMKYGAAVAAAPVSDTVKMSDHGCCIRCTLDRSRMWQVQTPQVFRKNLVDRMYAKHTLPGVTDDSQLAERLNAKVKLVQVGSYNIKITYPEDIIYAESILKSRVKD